MTGDTWDVAVVGAGPAGTAAALASHRAGASTVLLDRAVFPRNKTCAGGLVGASLRALPVGLQPPIHAVVNDTTMSLNGSWARRRRTPGPPLLSMTQRRDFDAALVSHVRRAGVTVLPGCAVHDLTDDRPATLNTALGPIRARSVVGADGATGRTRRFVGARDAQVDLGLEVEVVLPPGALERWRNGILIDWGSIPGSYGWVFPKGATATVGVIAERGHGAATRAFLDELLSRLGLGPAPGKVEGHLTRCRSADSPLARGNVLLAGDAAGLLDPWTREGISYALRSGSLAGHAAAQLARSSGEADRREHAKSYRRAVTTTLGVEMDAGRLFLEFGMRHPRILHAGLVGVPTLWRQFVDYARSDRNLTDFVRNPALRLAFSFA